MPCKVQIIEDRKIVKIGHHDALTRCDLVEMNSCCALTFSIRGWNKALLDWRKSDIQMPASEIAFRFKELDRDIPGGAIIAIVEPAQCDYDYCGLAKSMANAWTASTVEIFEDETAALGWLDTYPGTATSG